MSYFNRSKTCSTQDQYFNKNSIWNLTIPAIIFEFLTLFTLLDLIWRVLIPFLIVTIPLQIYVYLLCNRNIKSYNNIGVNLIMGILGILLGYLDQLFLSGYAMYVFIIVLTFTIF